MLDSRGGSVGWDCRQDDDAANDPMVARLQLLGGFPAVLPRRGELQSSASVIMSSCAATAPQEGPPASLVDKEWERGEQAPGAGVTEAILPFGRTGWSPYSVTVCHPITSC